MLDGDFRFGWSEVVSPGFARRVHACHFLAAVRQVLAAPQHSAVFEDVATVMPSAI